MEKRSRKHGGKRPGAGRPLANGEDGRAVRCSFSAPATLDQRLAGAAAQTGLSRSEIVCAGLEKILAQTPDRLIAEVRGEAG